MRRGRNRRVFKRTNIRLEGLLQGVFFLLFQGFDLEKDLLKLGICLSKHLTLTGQRGISGLRIGEKFLSGVTLPCWQWPPASSAPLPQYPQCARPPGPCRIQEARQTRHRENCHHGKPSDSPSQQRRVSLERQQGRGVICQRYNTLGLNSAGALS